MILPGVQALFAFLLMVPFTQRFPDLDDLQTGVFFMTLLCTAVATALLIAPSAHHRILWRVPNETMTSERVYPPIARDAPGGYYLKNVLWTQYFTSDGASIHYNYWSSNWGYSGSHGCLGLTYADSSWLWDWAQVGTPVMIHN